MYKVINVPIQKLRVYEENPRNNVLAVDKVKASIERVGFMFPIVIDMNHVIVCGHTRRAACEALGYKTVPCIMVDDLEPEQLDLFRFVDNKTSEYASWDYERLAEELRLLDMDLEPNKLIVNAFDFDLEAQEFDVVPTVVPVSTYNFMGSDYKKTGKPSPAEPEEEEDEDEWEDDDAPEGDGEDDDDDLPVVPEVKVSHNDGAAVVYGEENKGSPSVIHLFRCGSRRFIISEVEEERLVTVYTKYMAEVYPNQTFIQYLLGGADDVKV